LNVTISPTQTISGEVTAPPSKAQTHRALFAGLLSTGETVIQNPLSCDDTHATSHSITSLGATLETRKDRWVVRGTGRPHVPTRAIECGESGVTLRFTIPIASLTGSEVQLNCEETLTRRPLEPLITSMRELGVEVTSNRNGVSIRGQAPKGGSVHIRGDMSSQFISGLLLAAPLMQNGLELNLTSQLESRGYVSLTIEAMNRHGIHVESNNQMTLLKIQSGQAYHTATHLIPGDHSSAAFPMAAAAITGSKLLIRGLSKDNNEPDSVFTQLLSRMGTEIHYSTDGLLVEGGRLKASRVDISDCPDLGPAIAVLGCYAEGETEITGAGRLRYKESDRLGAMTTELATMGAQVTSTGDRLILRGSSSLKGGSVDSHGDHRVAMALSVAALRAKEDVTILDAECVSKSYPGFFNDLRTLGVRVVER